jgi:hypothetical protein
MSKNEHGLTFSEWRSQVDGIFGRAVQTDTRCLPELPEVDLEGEWECGVDPCDTAREAAFFYFEEFPDGETLQHMVEAEADRTAGIEPDRNVDIKFIKV